MTLIIGDVSQLIESFTLSIKKDKLITYINIEINNNINIDNFIELITNNFDGSFTISTSIKDYYFTEYEFESINMELDNNRETVYLYFTKIKGE